MNPENADQVWDAFLLRWPLEKLSELRLEEYSKAGGGKIDEQSKSFTYWIEKETEEIGSIWGGSSFKFGIYNRCNDEPKQGGRGRIFGSEYAWYEKYGSSAEEAFARVIAEVVKVATASRRGDFEEVERADLGPAFKWKIAFLYQDREHPAILPIFKLEMLMAVSGTDDKQSSFTSLYAQLMKKRGNVSLFAYAADLWKKGQEIVAQALTHTDAMAYLQTRFDPIKEPVKYIAGFKTSDGRQIALDRRGKEVKVYLEPDDWPSRIPGIEYHHRYQKDEERISNLEANAPSLGVGFTADLLRVPTMALLAALCDAYDEAAAQAPSVSMNDEHVERITMIEKSSMNTIFFGPPGTGKTFKTAEFAVGICDGEAAGSRPVLMNRYEELRREGRISFVTFHQSYGYEDFVEGLRPELKDGQISYRVRSGIFREVCDAARRSTMVKPGLTGKALEDRTIFKMSLGIAGTSEGKLAFQECIENGYVLLGYGGDVDFSECNGFEEIRKRVDEEGDFEKPESHARYVSIFKEELKIGDIIIVSQGNRAFRAIGEVTGEYEFLEAAAADSYHQMRHVRWLVVFEGNRTVEEIYDRNFVQSTLYKLDQDGLKLNVLEGILKGDQGNTNQAFVLIIDEINRANISKVFGELITLLEPDKREGEVNALTVMLPYSGDDFSVPSNLYVIGTMNTADRSIALLDTALRRRFEFEELQPDYSALAEMPVDGVDLRAMLAAMNERIEYLYDRDHTIGHAYFISVRTLAELDGVFRRKVIPLLQEYFYEDWSKVCLVLNDSASTGDFIKRTINVPKGLDLATNSYDQKPRYWVNSDQFSLASYLKIYE